jgi:hypothetical protein
MGTRLEVRQELSGKRSSTHNILCLAGMAEFLADSASQDVPRWHPQKYFHCVRWFVSLFDSEIHPPCSVLNIAAISVGCTVSSPTGDYPSCQRTTVPTNFTIARVKLG